MRCEGVCAFANMENAQNTLSSLPVFLLETRYGPSNTEYSTYARLLRYTRHSNSASDEARFVYKMYASISLYMARAYASSSSQLSIDVFTALLGCRDNFLVYVHIHFVHYIPMCVSTNVGSQRLKKQTIPTNCFSNK